MKPFLATLLFLTCPLPATAQNADSLRAFALRHDEFFRSQVSRFYPVPERLLVAFEEDWDWFYLSVNQAFRGSDWFFEKYRSRLGSDICFSDPKIVWTEAMIDSMGNKVSWFSLSMNPSLPLTEAFLKKYEDQIEWGFMLENPAFSKNENLRTTFADKKKHRIWGFNQKREGFEPWQIGSLVEPWSKNILYREPLELLDFMPQPIDSLTFAHLKKFSKWWDWNAVGKCPLICWDFPKIEALLEDIDLHRYLHSSSEIYRQIIEPHLTDSLLEAIMLELYPPESVSFYAIHPRVEDEFGYPPEASLKMQVDWRNVINFLDTSTAFLKVPDMILECRWAPPRFAAIHHWPSATGHRLVVSPKVKAVLERFRLPPHRFYPVNLSFSHPPYGSDSRQYFLFQLEKGVDWQYLDLENFRLFTFDGQPLEHEKIENEADYQRIRNQYREKNIGPHGRPIWRADFDVVGRPWIWKADFDVLGTDVERYSTGIWVSEDVKKALETSGLGNFKFRKIRKSKPRMTGVETPEHRARNARIIEEIRAEAAARPPEPEQASVQFFRKKTAWRAFVLAQKDLVKKHRATNPLPPDDNRAVQILREKELEFDVLLPETYLEKMRVGSWDKYESSTGVIFNIMPAEGIRQIHGWSAEHPYTVKAVLFAQNAQGDNLAFFLREGSAFELDDTVYEINTAADKIVKLGKLR